MGVLVRKDSRRAAREHGAPFETPVLREAQPVDVVRAGIAGRVAALVCRAPSDRSCPPDSALPASDVSKRPRPSSMNETTMSEFHLRPEISRLPTDETVGNITVPRSSAAFVRVMPLVEKLPLEEATLTEIGSPRAAAGTSAAKAKATQTALIVAPFLSPNSVLSKSAAQKGQRILTCRPLGMPAAVRCKADSRGGAQPSRPRSVSNFLPSALSKKIVSPGVANAARARCF